MHKLVIFARSAVDIIYLWQVNPQSTSHQTPAFIIVTPWMSSVHSHISVGHPPFEVSTRPLSIAPGGIHAGFCLWVHYLFKLGLGRFHIPLRRIIFQSYSKYVIIISNTAPNGATAPREQELLSLRLSDYCAKALPNFCAREDDVSKPFINFMLRFSSYKAFYQFYHNAFYQFHGTTFIICYSTLKGIGGGV